MSMFPPELIQGDQGANFEAQVQTFMRMIRTGGTPPFVSSPAYEEAKRRLGMGPGSLASLIAGLFGNKSNDPSQKGPLGSLAEMIMGQMGKRPQPSLPLDQAIKRGGMVIGTEPHAYNNPQYPTLGYPYNVPPMGDRSPLGNPIAPPEDNSWKVRPLPPNPYNTPGLWLNWRPPE